MADSIITKLKQSGLKGRGGAGFPVGKKWEAVKKAKAKKKYIICNVAEGDPFMLKDGFLLEKEPERIIDGVKIALKTFKNSQAFIYLRHDYYKKHRKKLEKLAGAAPIKLVEKPDLYLAGEETTVMEVIEGKRPEPRIKPPYPHESGLWGCPTLINNAETFYFVGQVVRGKYKNTRFYCISGEVKNKGVYELGAELTIAEILKQTKNFPNSNDFFAQAGGFFGEFYLLRGENKRGLPSELDRPLRGLGSVMVYSRKKTKFLKLAEEKLKFALYQNCDKCTPCREGTYRLYENLQSGEVNKKLWDDIFLVLQETSFCPLGRIIGECLRSLMKLG